MSMEISRQSQSAGDNSQQLQIESIGNLTIINGISEQRAREIFHEMNEIARRDYTSDAYALAKERVATFEARLMEKVEKVDGLLEAFADPSFQYLLADAQRRAAASEREADYAALAELLSCRSKHGSNRKIRAGISQAIKIVDEVDDDALCGLTASYAVWRMYPLNGSCSSGLDIIDSGYATLMYQSLPIGEDWINHLEILNAVRSTKIANVTPFENILENQFSGYVCAGIRKTSDDYSKAIEILSHASIPLGILVDHEWNKGFVRISLPHINYAKSLELSSPSGKVIRSLNEVEVAALNDVWNLYSKDPRDHEAVRKRFREEIQKHPHIETMRNWWNSLPFAFSLTHVGIVLAHANAQAHNSGIPDLTEL